ncbi:aldolase/citrate lyase family protein [Neobacillus sp. 114]|uniref:HpcH/HpaI aldolase family protein n=1 Tax=Neobacillus sp. 114 TaxID=3048535 RepID=UPI0024C3BBA7|nr:aldolase/citrate lyase family protein [Neobacillus sp. 114]
MEYALKKNSVKAIIQQGKTAFGMYVAIPSPVIVEIAGQSGMDFIRLDCCHSPLDQFTIEHMIRAAEARGILPFVRINHDPQKIVSVLEMGAAGIVVPDLSTAEEVQDVVNTARFLPLGARGMYSAPRAAGYGSVHAVEYANWSNEEVLIGIQIENARAVENVEEILSVPGINMVLSGRGDLAQSLGVTGQKNHPLVLEAEEKIFNVAKSKGIAISVNLDPTSADFAENVDQWVRKGAQVITFGVDTALIRKTFENMMSIARNQ